MSVVGSQETRSPEINSPFLCQRGVDYSSTGSVGRGSSCFSKSLQPAFLIFSLSLYSTFQGLRSWASYGFCGSNQAFPTSTSWIGLLRSSKFITIHPSSFQPPKLLLLPPFPFFAHVIVPVKTKSILRSLIEDSGRNKIIYTCLICHLYQAVL